MLLSFDPISATVRHACEACHTVTTLRIHPQFGDLVVAHGTITTKPCACGAFECLRADCDPVDAGEQRHPDSLVGTKLPGGNEVIADGRDRQDNPARVRQAQLLRAMQRHPHLASVAPLNERIAR